VQIIPMDISLIQRMRDLLEIERRPLDPELGRNILDKTNVMAILRRHMLKAEGRAKAGGGFGWGHGRESFVP
jgi:hypothetical protein